MQRNRSDATATTNHGNGNIEANAHNSPSMPAISAYVHDRYLDAEERFEIFVVKAAERPHLLHWTASTSTSGDGTYHAPAGGGGADDDDAADEYRHDDEKKIEEHDDTTNLLSTPPPLTDGCDIPGWRCQRIAPGMNPNHSILTTQPQQSHSDDRVENKIQQDIEYPLGGSLNIGAGSFLTRLESQFPFMSSRLYSTTRNQKCHNNYHQYRQYCCCCWWHHAKEQYRFRSFHTTRGGRGVAPTIEYEEAKRMVNFCVMSGNEDTLSSSSSNTDQLCKRQITYFTKEYEIKNRPVKILGATKGWLAMPSYAGTTSNARSNDTISCCDRLPTTTHDDAKDDSSKVDISSSTSSSSWRDVGEESMLFQGGGKGGWTFANLIKRYGNTSFRFSDTHGEMMSLSIYAKYITNPEGMLDDSPLGIYDSEFGDDLSSPISELLKEYCVPECFSRDLFELIEADDEDSAIESNDGKDDDANNPSTNTRSPTRTRTARPPYRWILIGPERSGTGMHVDPLWTNAWVTVLQGQKQWLLFPPDTPYNSIGMIEGSPQIPSSIWFRDFYDVVTSPSWPKQYRPVEVLQNPGETVFVPAGWPHLVLNLELTVAVTHNYASEYGPHFDRMWEEVGRDEPDFAARWLAGLRKHGRDDLTARCYGMRH